MNTVNDEWERLRAVIEAKGMSINYFAKRIGLPDAEFVYCMKHHRECCGSHMRYTPRLEHIADRVVATFPDISREWLLTGEGCMFAE